MPRNNTEQTIQWLGTRYKILLTADETDGKIGMFESVDQPGYGPPRHIHHEEDETFYILSGEVLFWLAGESRTLGPAATVFIPRGTDHTFRVLGDLPARMLTIMTPGDFEGFFAEMAKHQLRIPEDMDKIAEIGLRYHLELTGPPLS
jgi:mannose-6-phosphate isomerase-like protein (cupin superfamily)